MLPLESPTAIIRSAGLKSIDMAILNTSEKIDLAKVAF
jgi:hypothetical protein